MLDRRLLELALQTSGDPTLIIDSKLSIFWANLAAHEEPEKMQGRHLDEFLSLVKPASDFYQPELGQQLQKKLSMLPFGEVRWRHTQLAPESGGGSVLLIRWHLLAEMPDRYILVNLHNHGRRRSDPGPAEQALRSQQIFMNQLIHELRTPLAIALGGLRRVGLQLNGAPDACVEYLDMTAQELRRMQRLIDHLTILSDVDAGSQRWRLKPVLFNSFLRQWYQRLPESSRDRVYVLLEGEAQLQHVSIDPEALELVLNNLIDNAVKYGASDRGIVIRVMDSENALRIYVADWGQGIDVAVQDVVFDRFRRLEHHRDPSRADGAGLGLAVCRALLGLMNGHISFVPAAQPGLSGSNIPSTVVKVNLPLLGLKADIAQPPLDESVSQPQRVKEPAILAELSRYLDAAEPMP